MRNWSVFVLSTFYLKRPFHIVFSKKNENKNKKQITEDKVDTAHNSFRSVARRKTDLMPTIPSPRDGHYGSRTSLNNTPRTPGKM